MTYLRADLPVRQKEAEAQRSREMSAALFVSRVPHAVPSDQQAEDHSQSD